VAEGAFFSRVVFQLFFYHFGTLGSFVLPERMRNGTVEVFLEKFSRVLTVLEGLCSSIGIGILYTSNSRTRPRLAASFADFFVPLFSVGCTTVFFPIFQTASIS